MCPHVHMTTCDPLCKTCVFVHFFLIPLASERPIQPCTQRYKWWSWQFNTKGSSLPTRCLLSPQHHSHLQSKMLSSSQHTAYYYKWGGNNNSLYYEEKLSSYVFLVNVNAWQYVWLLTFFSVGYPLPALLHSIGQHRAGETRQSVCGHRSEIQLELLIKNVVRN